VAAGAVASFRTWRGSRPSLAQDPAINGEQRREKLRGGFLGAELLQYHSKGHATASRDFDPDGPLIRDDRQWKK